MRPSLSEQDLRAAIISTVRRQHILGAYPAAMAVAPLTAIAVGELFKQQLGRNVIEDALCGPNHTQIQLPSPSKELLDHRYPVVGSILVDSCRTCSRMCPQFGWLHTGQSSGMLDMCWSLPAMKGLAGTKFTHCDSMYHHLPSLGGLSSTRLSVRGI